ncbi:MAG: sugar ABC transporter ATP-binding protein [Rhodobacteraceae bacterium]|nr:sugar ABC transporter ATP-binding protein [Paracoccaceae bacterium]
MTGLGSPRVELRNIHKSFPGVVALDDVNLSFQPGRVHALLGENGAGKSTLIKVLSGALAMDSGQIFLDGQLVDVTSTTAAQAMGISTVFQEVNLIPAMSVVKNMALARNNGRYGFISWKRARKDATDRLKRLRLDIDIERPVGSYSVAIQQLIAISRALEDNTSILVLDEPTASLDAKETASLFAVINELKSNGIAIVFITHFLDQVFDISDDVSILRNGQLVSTDQIKDLTRQDVITQMIGRELDEAEHTAADKSNFTAGKDMLVAKGLGRHRTLAPFDLTLRAGEVVGLAGLLGSGRTEMVKLVFGAIQADAGSIEIDGVKMPKISPQKSLRAGIAFCPEDRKAEGLIGELSIRENIMLSMQAKRGWLKRVSRKEQEKLAEEMIKALAIATPDAEKPVGQLSGGNQQKVVLARSLASTPRILLLDEPTRGIDVGAHAEIIALIRRLCADGMALLVASSELDEIVAAADRVVVMRDRHKIGEIDGKEITRDNIIQMIASQ